MLSTCIFCHGPLGHNEAIDAFPVGRRLAFDGERGRLWVVCPSCARWNLTPLESRWEAVEQCEKLFRDSRLRVSTGEIGLAKVREGTTLVRIGSPLLPEMAAWRYGERFQSRRRRYFAVGAASALGIGAVMIGGPLTGAITWTGALNLFNILNALNWRRAALKLPLDGSIVKLNYFQMASVALRPHDAEGFVLEFSHRGSKAAAEQKPHRSRRITDRNDLPTILTGEAAIRAARHFLPHINGSGGSANHVRDGVALLERGNSVTEMFSAAARTPTEELARWKRAAWNKSPERGPVVLLPSLPAPVRLALEMAIHEEDERRALEGELAELEERWREAEEIAAIADDLVVPAPVKSSLRRLKGE